MTGAVAPAAVNSAAEPVGFEWVLAGVALAGPAAELAGRLDRAFLTDAGWDPVSRVLSLPAGHPLLGRTVCRVGGCISTAHSGPAGGVCWRCFTRLGARGLDRAADRVVAGAPAVAGPTSGVRRSGVPADVAGPKVNAVRPAFQPIPTGAVGVAVTGAVHGRSAGAAAVGVGSLSSRGMHPENRIGPRLLPDPLPAVAHRDRRPTLPPTGGIGRRRSSAVRRGRAGQPAGASTAGGRRNAVRCPATRPGRWEGERRYPAGGLRHGAPPAGTDDRGPAGRGGGRRMCPGRC